MTALNNPSSNLGDTLMTHTTMNHRPGSDERRAFGLVFGLTFALALPIVCLSRVMPRTGLSSSSAGSRPSVVAEARSAASAAIGYAFTG